MSAGWMGWASAPGDAWPAWAMVAGSVAASAGALALVPLAPRRLVVSNYAGRAVPAVLGLALVPAAVGVALAVAGAAPGRRLEPVTVAVLVAVVGVAAAGLADDLAAGGPRGLRGHLGSLVRGRATTGLLKLAAGVAAGAGVALVAGGGPVRVVAAAVLVAACANVWNALDVAPGRAGKWGAVVLLVLLGPVWETPVGVPVGAALGAAVGILPLDLLERGMLGDAGSNALGVAVGAGLAVALPTAGVVAAAAAALLLQVAAETVTISRLIAAVPPLRWLEGLGRRPPRRPASPEG